MKPTRKRKNSAASQAALLRDSCLVIDVEKPLNHGTVKRQNVITLLQSSFKPTNDRPIYTLIYSLASSLTKWIILKHPPRKKNKSDCEKNHGKPRGIFFSFFFELTYNKRSDANHHWDISLVEITAFALNKLCIHKKMEKPIGPVEHKFYCMSCLQTAPGKACMVCHCDPVSCVAGGAKAPFPPQELFSFTQDFEKPQRICTEIKLKILPSTPTFH